MSGNYSIQLSTPLTPLDNNNHAPYDPEQIAMLQNGEGQGRNQNHNNQILDGNNLVIQDQPSIFYSTL